MVQNLPGCQDRSVRKSIFFCLMILFCIPSLTYGEQPIDVLQTCIQKGIRILKDPDYQNADQKEMQRQKLCQTVWQVFDFDTFSRLVLASNWRIFTSQQRQEFTDAFGRFLCKYYLTRLQEKYKNEKIIYVGQDMVSSTKALIKIKVLWRGLEVPAKIRMLMRNGAWKVYDVNVLGISAVLSYREQFRALLLKDSPAQVIGLIEDRIDRSEADIDRFQ